MNMNMLHNNWTSKMPVVGVISRSVVVAMTVVAIYCVAIIIVAAVIA